MGSLLKWLVAGLAVFFAVGLLLPAVQTGCRGGRRMQSASNLRQIGLGLLAYSNDFHYLPPGATFAPDGTPLHGWPTLILPYVDNVELYNAINLARPWDDPEMRMPSLASNRTSTGETIGIYRNPQVVDVPDEIRATAFGYATNAWVVGGSRSLRLDQIGDGAASTILGGEAGGDYRPWGMPVHWRDPGLGINKAPQGFGAPWSELGANFLFADGSVRFLRDGTSMATFRALATPNGGETVDLDELP